MSQPITQRLKKRSPIAEKLESAIGIYLSNHSTAREVMQKMRINP